MDTEVDILTLLAYHEQALGNMYKTFSEKFGREVWSFLTSEEFKHNDWILSISDNVFDGSVKFESKSYTEKIISDSINEMDEMRIMCDMGSIPESKAFEFSIKIEERMIEKSFLESFSSHYPGIQGVIDNLKGETEIHRDVLKNEFDKFQKGSNENKNQSKILFKYASTLGLHAEYERLLARLYATFSNLFPEEEIWKILVEEEKKHEAWIKQIIMKVVQGTITFKNNDDTDEYIINAVQGLKDTLNDIKIDGIKKDDTFEIAYNVENSILEKEFFNKFSSDAPIIDKILKSLVKDTERHRDMLDERIFTKSDI